MDLLLCHLVIIEGNAFKVHRLLSVGIDLHGRRFQQLEEGSVVLLLTHLEPLLLLLYHWLTTVKGIDLEVAFKFFGSGYNDLISHLL